MASQVETDLSLHHYISKKGTEHFLPGMANLQKVVQHVLKTVFIVVVDLILNQDYLLRD